MLGNDDRAAMTLVIAATQFKKPRHQQDNTCNSAVLQKMHSSGLKKKAIGASGVFKFMTKLSQE